MSRTIKLTEEERERLVAETDPEFPKYTTQIMNTANQNVQGTRPPVIGQMSEIIEEYIYTLRRVFKNKRFTQVASRRAGRLYESVVVSLCEGCIGLG
jgi:tRNA/tmRNA/rRNA uracil-C5-methylase (TrmA/RlmC/RlmD family)